MPTCSKRKRRVIVYGFGHSLWSAISCQAQSSPRMKKHIAGELLSSDATTPMMSDMNNLIVIKEKLKIFNIFIRYDTVQRYRDNFQLKVIATRKNLL